MYSKKMLNMCILEILREYSDENHRLKQQDIIRLLKQDYNMDCDRKSIRANIMNLMEFGYDIDCEESVRKNKDGEEEVLSTDWYLIRDFDDSELKILINSVLFCKMIPVNQAKVLIEKIKGLSNHYFNMKVKHVCNLPQMQHTNNKNTLYNLDIIDEAIEQGKQISFIYNTYGTDKELHSRREEPFIMNPYQTVANNGNYYLICNYDKYDDMSYYRVDRMTGVRILDSAVKPMSQVRGMENGLNLPKHIAEHIYMFPNDTISIILKADKNRFGEVVDWFGTDFVLLDESEEYAKIRLECSERAMFYWAMQYSGFVEVLEPTGLREQLKEAAERMVEKYK